LISFYLDLSLFYL